MRISTILILLLTLIHFNSNGQSLRIVRDSITQEPIPFANIWIDGEKIGTTSNENGEFHFLNDINRKTLILSSLGYKRKKILIGESQNIILLKPEAIELKEILVTQKRKQKNTKVGEFKPSEIRHSFGCDGTPWIAARYFPYNAKISETPFISKLEFFTTSRVENSIVNLRFYTKNENGIPDTPIFNENIIVAIKKGRNVTTVDLTDKLIQFPSTGVLIAIEFLILEQNKFAFTYTMPPDTAKINAVGYAPSIGTIPNETGENSWKYSGGQWRNTAKYNSVGQFASKKYTDKYTDLAIKLTLSN